MVGEPPGGLGPTIGSLLLGRAYVGTYPMKYTWLSDDFHQCTVKCYVCLFPHLIGHALTYHYALPPLHTSPHFTPVIYLLLTLPCCSDRLDAPRDPPGIERPRHAALPGHDGHRWEQPHLPQGVHHGPPGQPDYSCPGRSATIPPRVCLSRIV